MVRGQWRGSPVMLVAKQGLHARIMGRTLQ
jgi:hypothetical protein